MAEREAYWREMLRRQTQSGESIAEFCHNEGVSITGRSYRLRHQATGENTAADSKTAIPPAGSRLRKKRSAPDGESTQSADSAAATACQA